MSTLACTNCRRPYPPDGLPYRCPICGGIFDDPEQLVFDPARIEHGQPGIWRFRHTFGSTGGATPISLMEGGTPLVWAEAYGRKIAFKLEYLNPTGSFKDRGTTLLVSHLVARGVGSAVEDSSGNAGASFAAYAARAGLKARVFVPDSASGPKRAQIAAYGAEVIRILGPRSNSAGAARRAAEKGEVYASHAYLPFGLPGFATLAYELVEQLGQTPGTVIVPAGQGSLLLGIGRGFDAMYRANAISRIPVLVGVQAKVCAPLWAVHTAGPAGLGWVTEGTTLAEGVRILTPLRGDAVLKIVEDSGGTLVAVEEGEIVIGQECLARLGFFVEPTSAIVWGALGQVAEQIPEPIVVVLTGSGYKSILVPAQLKEEIPGNGENN